SNLMEDAATSEIARSQVWQWVHHAARLKDGPEVTPELVRKVEDEELEEIRQAIGHEEYGRGRFEEARVIFEDVALGDDFVEFLTIPAIGSSTESPCWGTPRPLENGAPSADDLSSISGRSVPTSALWSDSL
ncbi:MAG TPA: hypothetical protein VGR13_03170, partial [Actinomycetota bacterium]|nr:hypothetical protein [Actinomycetota bacterium]